jgi:hypothetical protein
MIDPTSPRREDARQTGDAAPAPRERAERDALFGYRYAERRVSFLRLLESIHGHLGVLAAIGLLHPAILLRRGKPLTRGHGIAILLTSLAVVGVFATGLLLYPEYIRTVRTGLFLRSATAGFLFETKEHLAYAVIAMTAGATGCAVLAPRADTARRRLAALLYAIAAVLCLIVVALGSYIASVAGFS